MLDECDLTVTHTLRNNKADLRSTLSEIARQQRLVNSRQQQLYNTIQIVTLDGDGLSGLYILHGIGAANRCQRYSEVNRCGQTRIRSQHDATRYCVGGNLNRDGLAVFGSVKVHILNSGEVDAGYEVKVLTRDGDGLAELWSRVRYASSNGCINGEIGDDRVLCTVGTVVIGHITGFRLHRYANLDFCTGVLDEVLSINYNVVEEDNLTDVPYIFTLDGNDVARVDGIRADGRDFNLFGKSDIRGRHDGLTAIRHQTQFTGNALVGNRHCHLLGILKGEFTINIGGGRSQLLVSLREENLLHIVELGTCHTHCCTTCNRHGAKGKNVHATLVVLVGIKVIRATAGKSSCSNQCSHGHY